MDEIQKKIDDLTQRVEDLEAIVADHAIGNASVFGYPIANMDMFTFVASDTANHGNSFIIVNDGE